MLDRVLDADEKEEEEEEGVLEGPKHRLHNNQTGSQVSRLSLAQLDPAVNGWFGTYRVGRVYRQDFRPNVCCRPRCALTQAPLLAQSAEGREKQPERSTSR